jgi:hypothetical protein
VVPTQVVTKRDDQLCMARVRGGLGASGVSCEHAHLGHDQEDRFGATDCAARKENPGFRSEVKDRLCV